MCRTQPSSQGPPTVAGLQATPTWAAGRTFITHDLTTSLPSTAPCCPEEEPPTPWPSEQGLRSAHLACPSSLTAWVRSEKQTSVCGTLLLTSRHPQIPVHAQSLSPCLAGMHDPLPMSPVLGFHITSSREHSLTAPVLRQYPALPFTMFITRYSHYSLIVCSRSLVTELLKRRK